LQELKMNVDEPFSPLHPYLKRKHVVSDSEEPSTVRVIGKSIMDPSIVNGLSTIRRELKSVRKTCNIEWGYQTPHDEEEFGERLQMLPTSSDSVWEVKSLEAWL